MKGVLCALLALRSLTAAQAYEADVHYSTTYVLARAVGWPAADALTIASANQGVDENQDTVAALEVEATASSPFSGHVMSSYRQAEKNLRFHCFSRTREQGEGISADVRRVIAGHFAQVPDHNGEPRQNAQRLIALGVALHCQQDAYSHLGFGGSCGPHSGSCHGHAHQTFLDRVVFGLLGKHYFNPDHPGASGPRLLVALQATARELAAHRSGPSRSIPLRDLIALSEALRTSGLELPDDVRLICNRHIAGKWLFEFLNRGNGPQATPDASETLAHREAAACKNASLASAKIARIPVPRFPYLKSDASPHLVRVDGSYRLLRDAKLAGSPSHAHLHRVADAAPHYPARKIRLQLSDWNQVLALPLMRRGALLSADTRREASCAQHRGDVRQDRCPRASRPSLRSARAHHIAD